MAKLNKEEAEKKLKAGESIVHEGRIYASKTDMPEKLKDAHTVYDENGALTHEGMEATIKGGGSVLFKGETVTDLEKLPTAEDIEKHQADQERQRVASIDSQIAALNAQRPARVHETAEKHRAK